MIHICGIILLEKTEIIIRIYEVNKDAWKLIHYQNFHLMLRNAPVVHQDSLANEISTMLADFLTTDKARYVTQWKTGSRTIAQTTLNRVSASLGLEIESLSFIREQELLCKGLFTELW
jgi:hypothetical protein